MLVIGSAKPRHTPHHFATPESPNSHSVFTYPGTFTLRTLCQRHLVDIYKRLSFPFCCLLFRASSYNICWTRCPVVLQSPALTPSHNPLRYGDLTSTFGVPLSASRINDPCPSLLSLALCILSTSISYHRKKPRTVSLCLFFLILRKLSYHSSSG